MKRRRTKQLELIIEELQLIRAQLELTGPQQLFTTVSSTPSINFSWDPGADRLQEMLDEPDGELATELKEMPVTPTAVTDKIREMLADHDAGLVRRLQSY